MAKSAHFLGPREEVQGPHLLSLYQNTNDKQYNLVQGPQLEVQGPFMCARASYFAFLPNY